MLPALSASLYQSVQAIVVKVWVDDYWASGILIGRSGDRYAVLTNQHVLDIGKRYQIQTSDGLKRPAVLLPAAQFGGQDLGLLTFTDPNHDYPLAAIGDVTPPEVGTSVAAAGFPFDYKLDRPNESPPVTGAAGATGETRILPGNLWLTTGQVSRVVDRQFRQGYQVGYTNLVLKGMSGGPLVNGQGCLVGINGRHAYPIWGNPYVYKDGSRPAAEEEATLIRSSWAIPLSTVLPTLQSIAGWQWGDPCPTTDPVAEAANRSQWVTEAGLRLIGSSVGGSLLATNRSARIAWPTTPLAAIARVQIGQTMAIGVILTQQRQDDRRYQYRVLLSGNHWEVGSLADLVTAEGQTYPAQVTQAWPEDQLTLVEFRSHRLYKTVQLGRLSTRAGATVTAIGLQAWPGSEQFTKAPLTTAMLPASYAATLTTGSQADHLGPAAQFCTPPVPLPAKGGWPLFDHYQRLTGWLQLPASLPAIAPSPAASSPSPTATEPTAQPPAPSPTASPSVTPLPLTHISAQVLTLPPQVWQLLDRQSAATPDRPQS